MTRTKSVKALLVVLMSAALIIAFMPQTAFTSYAATAKKATSVTRSYPTTKATYSMTVGQSKTFRVRLNPKNLAKASKTTFWSLNTSKYASLAKGKYSTKYKKVNGYWYAYTTLKATKAGPVTITAKSKYGPTASWNVTVKKVLTDVTISNETTGSMTAITVGDVLKANITPATKYAKYTWYAVAADGTKTVLTDEAQKDNTYKVTGAAAGKQIMVEANGFTYAQGKVESKATTAKVAVGTLGVKIVLPEGETGVKAGDTLTATVTPVDSDVTYQWYNASGIALADGTGSTYLIPATLTSGTYYVKVTSKSDSTKQAESNHVSICTPLNSVEVVPTTPGNTVGLGTELTAKSYYMAGTTKTPTAGDVTYKWYVDSVTDANQIYTSKYAADTTQTAVTGDTFTPAAKGFYLKDATTETSMQGHKIIAVAVGGGTTYTGTVQSVATDTISSALVSATLDASAATTIGMKVSPVVKSTAGTVADLTKVSGLTYQWYRGIDAISGETGSSYTITKADAGKSISVKVTGSGDFSGAVNSNMITATGTATAITKPVVKNNDTTKTTFVLGDTLKATMTPAAAADAIASNVTYQWYKGLDKISGATSQTYTPAVVGDYKVTITLKTGVTDYTLDSAQDTSDAVTVKTGISGVTIANTTATTAKRTYNVLGDVLTATVSPAATYTTDYTVKWTKTDAKGVVTDLTAETDGTYKLVAGDAGCTIKATVKAATGGSLAGEATSTALSITYPVSTVGVTGGSGTTLWTANPAVGTTYTAAATSASTATPAVTYQWYRNGKAIDKATTATYTVTAADFGAALSVVATGKDGFTGTATSAATGAANVTKELAALTADPAAGSNIAAGSTVTVSFATADVTLGATASNVTYKWTKTKDSVTTTIEGQTGASYTTTAADAGYTVKCEVSTKTGEAFTVPTGTAFTYTVQ